MRFFKYALLLALTIATGYALASVFSIYAARIEIEDEIQKADATASFDLMLFENERAASLSADIVALRCAQRDLVTLYRLQTLADRAALSDLYLLISQARRRLMERLPAYDAVVDREESAKRLEFTWGLPRPDELAIRVDAALDPAGLAAIDGARAMFARDVADEVASVLRSAAPTVNDLLRRRAIAGFPPPQGRPATVDELAAAMAELHRRDAAAFALSGIREIQQRITTLVETVAEGAQRRDQLLPVFVRFGRLYQMFRGATPEAAMNQSLARFADPQTGSFSLAELDCRHGDGALKARIAARGADLLRPHFGDADAKPALDAALDSALAKVADHSTTGGSALNGGAGFGPFAGLLNRTLGLDRLLYLPTSMQVLFVTLLSGALGALTGCMLRMTHIGTYWVDMRDPDVGDIVVGLFQGAVAAFIIYLVGSLGLVVLGERQGGEIGTTSAQFIAFLGFISGFLNREAFGRVRELGLNVFNPGAGAGGSTAHADPADIALADLLTAAGARLMATLVLRHGLGRKLTASGPFTLFAPLDAHLEASLTAGQWLAMSGPAGAKAAETFLAAHVVSGRLEPGDLPTAGTVTLRDGRTVDVAVTGDTATVGAATLTPTKGFAAGANAIAYPVDRTP